MKKIVPGLGLSALAGPALALTAQGAADGLLHGLLHPVLGPDHLLAMLAVGLWSAFVLPRRVWGGAAVFLAAMVAGAGLSWGGVPIPGVEALILGSVLVFGLLVLVARPDQSRLATQLSLLAIALFAVCHGHAHATEARGAVALYLAGFLVATAALHLAGIALARIAAGGTAAVALQRGLGAALSAAGLWMMAG